ncbi:unnamed protein product, partial [Timema podura]|nr:unnamed protein product [Timema podura]
MQSLIQNSDNFSILALKSWTFPMVTEFSCRRLSSTSESSSANKFLEQTTKLSSVYVSTIPVVLNQVLKFPPSQIIHGREPACTNRTPPHRQHQLESGSMLDGIAGCTRTNNVGIGVSANIGGTEIPSNLSAVAHVPIISVSVPVPVPVPISVV